MVVKQLHILETYYRHSLLSLVLLFLVSQMPLDNEDVQAIAQALQALLPATPAAATPPATISSVSIKLPPFWTTRPEVWFRQVETQFATRIPAITVDLTKFNHVVAALDNITAGEVEAIILSPPADGKYDALKAALINAFGKTQASKDMELRSLYRKPSSLLHHMKSLNADPMTLLRTLFLAQLPMEVCHILAELSTTDLNDLAKDADAIMEVSSRAFSATGISGVHNPMSSTTVAMSKDLCFYHMTFDKEARKCDKGGCKLACLIPSSTSTSSTTASGNRQAGH